MRKAELIQEISYRTQLDQETILRVFDQAITEIKRANMEGESVYIRGFGTFEVITQKATIGRNITKGTVINIPERKKPRLKPSKLFINEVNS